MAMLAMKPEDIPSEPAPPMDLSWMCMPRLPFMSKPSRNPPFFKVNHLIPWPVAMIMGFQHALAMLGGIVSVPLIVGGPFDANLTNDEKQYLISAGLISSGILSMIQIYRMPLGESGYFIGTGLVSVLGTSFTFVPIARSAIGFMKNEASDIACTAATAATDCANGRACLNSGFCSNYSGQEAYGGFLGTAAICALLEILLSFVPRANLRRICPPIVTGVCVLCIGVALTGTGIKYWGGGAFCADHSYKRQSVMTGESFPGDVTATYESKSPCVGGACIPFRGSLSGVCSYTAPKYDEEKDMTMGDKTTCVRFKDTPGVFPPQTDVQMSVVKCGDNGEVFLPFGAAEYVGLGFVVFMFLLLTEIFGSPFVRNCQVAIALLLGFAVAAIARYDVPGSEAQLKYVNDAKIKAAPAITFLWVETFPLSVYAPAIIPTLLAFIITTVETVGDVSASAEASRVHEDGQLDSRIQGGVLADGICSILSCLMTVLPNTTFSQNNGVIALTRCANRRAGYCCCVFLICFGIIAKISAVINSIPYCVLGGMTTFLFVNIVVSGIKILGPELDVRRNRFIVAASLAIALGVALVPAWANNDLVRSASDVSNQFLGQTAVIILTTPYCIGTLLAIFLHAIIPVDEDENMEEEPAPVPEKTVVDSAAPMPIMYHPVTVDPMSGQPMNFMPPSMPMQPGMPGMYPSPMMGGMGGMYPPMNPPMQGGFA